jgi:hypothetical protein
MVRCRVSGRRRRRLAVEALEPRTLLSAMAGAAPQGPYISEFLANNGGGITDADGDRSDWIEIRNPAAFPVDLAGYSLTDDPLSLKQWQFPAVTLPAGGTLLVFASGKDRRTPGAELHANFKLDADGEYLALVAPGGTAADVLTEFNPYPPQVVDVSYGLDVSESVTPFLASDAAGRLAVPASEPPAGWTIPSFDDAAWSPTRGAIGYDDSTAPERIPARVGEQSAQVLNCVYLRPFFARRSIVGVGIGPPNVDDAPNPTSSVRITRTLGAPPGAVVSLGKSFTEPLIVRSTCPLKGGSGRGRTSWAVAVSAIAAPNAETSAVPMRPVFIALPLDCRLRNRTTNL